MGRTRARRGWFLGGALLAWIGIFLALRCAGGPSPDPADDAGGVGGGAPAARSADPAPAPDAKPATLDASGPRRPSPGAAPTEASASAPAEAPVAELRGLVVDEAGRPVARAEVSGRDRAESDALLEGTVLPVIAVTGADGRFTVPPGARLPSRAVNVAAPGLCQRGSEAFLKAGVETRIVMVAACPLRVHVTEEGSGRPVPDALVHAITGSWVAAVFGHALDAPTGGIVRTDETGRATLPTEGGPALLVVRPSRHAPVVVSGITVPRGGTDVEVRAARGGIFAVSVRRPDGTALPGARVRLDVRPAYRQRGVTDVDGRLRFEGLPTSVAVADLEEGAPPTLTVSSPGLEALGVEIELPAPGETLSREIRMRPARWIRGSVRTAEGAVAAGVRIRAEMRSLSDPMERLPEGVSGPDGTFVVGPVALGLFAVQALGRNGDPVAGVDVEVPAEGEPPSAEIRMPSTEGRLTVRVVGADGTGVAGARLEIRATRGMYRLAVAEGLTDATGIARLAELAPESAVLLVRPPGSAPLARDLTATDYDGRELRVVLGNETIEGRVIGFDRRPRRARVRILADVDGCITDGAVVESDPSGAFGFTRLSPGTLRLDVDEADGVLVGGDALIPAGARTVTLMVVSPAEAARLHVELRLLDAATGTPVPVPAFRAKVVLVRRVDAREWNAPHGPDDAEGRFLSFETLPPGAYDGRLVVPGYKDVELGVVTLPADGEARTLRLDRSEDVGK